MLNCVMLLCSHLEGRETKTTTTKATGGGDRRRRCVCVCVCSVYRSLQKRNQNGRQLVPLVVVLCAHSPPPPVWICVCVL